jgi:hypothetical protein
MHGGETKVYNNECYTLVVVQRKIMCGAKQIQKLIEIVFGKCTAYGREGRLRDCPTFS